MGAQADTGKARAAPARSAARGGAIGLGHHTDAQTPCMTLPSSRPRRGNQRCLTRQRAQPKAAGMKPFSLEGTRDWGWQEGARGLPCPNSFSWVLQLCCSYAGYERITRCLVRAGVTQCGDSPQFAKRGTSSFSPFAHASAVLMSCPKGFAGSAASLGAFVSPLTSDRRVTHSISDGSKGTMNAVLFVDTGICSAHCKSRGLVKAEELDVQRFPRSPQPEVLHSHPSQGSTGRAPGRRAQRLPAPTSPGLSHVIKL